MKKCSKCKVKKDKTAFYTNINNYDLCDWWCKTCRKKHALNYQKNLRKYKKERDLLETMMYYPPKKQNPIKLELKKRNFSYALSYTVKRVNNRDMSKFDIIPLKGKKTYNKKTLQKKYPTYDIDWERNWDYVMVNHEFHHIFSLKEVD